MLLTTYLFKCDTFVLKREGLRALKLRQNTIVRLMMRHCIEFMRKLMSDSPYCTHTNTLKVPFEPSLSIRPY